MTIRADSQLHHYLGSTEKKTNDWLIKKSN
jgi:hypothetical protein